MPRGFEPKSVSSDKMLRPKRVNADSYLPILHDARDESGKPNKNISRELFDYKQHMHGLQVERYLLNNQLNNLASVLDSKL